MTGVDVGTDVTHQQLLAEIIHVVGNIWQPIVQMPVCFAGLLRVIKVAEEVNLLRCLGLKTDPGMETGCQSQFAGHQTVGKGVVISHTDQVQTFLKRPGHDGPR